jgi:hypothetical protein
MVLLVALVRMVSLVAKVLVDHPEQQESLDPADLQVCKVIQATQVSLDTLVSLEGLVILASLEPLVSKVQLANVERQATLD